MTKFENRDFSNLGVPSSVADVSSEWLQQVLHAHFPHVVIRQVVPERIGEGYGLASEIYRFRWESSRPPDSVVVKLWDTAGSVGTREVDFYHTFARPLKPWVPACYHAAIDSEKGRGVLVLADLSPVTQGDCLFQLPCSLSEVVARNLAGVHATWLEREELYLASWLPSLASWGQDPGWYEPRRSAFLERFAGRLDGRARSLLDRFELAQQVVKDRLSNAPNTLLHVDFHLDNYVFVHGTRPVLLDWANCARGPLAFDLYELLFSMSAVSDREQVFKVYSDSFIAYSGRTLDQVELWRQLGGAFLRSFARSTFGIARWQPASPREVAMIDVGLERILRALGDWYFYDPSLFDFLD